MPDKDIDKLFRDKLDGFEAEPSARVWEGISQELQGDKRRMVPIWGIAASVLLFVAAGLYFILPQKQVNTKGSKGQQTAVSTPKTQVQPSTVIPADTASQNEIKQVIKTNPVALSVQQVAVTKHSRNYSDAPVTGKAQEAAQTPQQATEQPTVITTNPEPLMAANTAKLPVTTPVVPDANVPLAIKQITADANPQVMANASNAPQTKPARKRHGAFTLGDLINTVVSTVDKRADKVIEFTDTDDDQSNITGINLGIIKIKKNNNK